MDSWIQKYGNGSISGRSTEGSMENSGVKLFVLTWKPADGSGEIVTEGNFSMQTEVSCRASEDGGKGVKPCFLVMLEYVGSGSAMPEYTCLKCHVADRSWTIERNCRATPYEQGGVYIDHMVSPVDMPENLPTVSPGEWHRVRVEVRGGVQVSVFVNEVPILQEAALQGAATHGPCRGPLGLAVTQAKLDWKAWQVERNDGPVAGLTGRKASQMAYVGDDRRLVETVEGDILHRSTGVTFDDIASLTTAKHLLNEAVALPLLIPDFFTGIREPWKGVLLFGPPGTGKTLLAKAVAGSTAVCFFNCSGATLTSKYRGESEKLVRCLFNMAHHYAPSIIFFDEVDALVSRRGEDGEHEASRRFKSELLSLMDGIASPKDEEEGKLVMVLATTNCPWDLDDALRRRLEKRIFIPLPDRASRRDMLALYLQQVKVQGDVDLEALALKLEGYSGADIRVICRDAAMMPMRRLVLNKTPAQLLDLRAEGKLEAMDSGISMQDLLTALEKTQPSVGPSTIKRFAQWDKEFGST